MYSLASSLLVTLILSASHSSRLFFTRMSRTHAGKLRSFRLRSSVSLQSSLFDTVFHESHVTSSIYCARQSCYTSAVSWPASKALTDLTCCNCRH